MHARTHTSIYTSIPVYNTYTQYITHVYIYIYIFHSMWTTKTSTRYVWEAEPGVPDE